MKNFLQIFIFLILSNNLFAQLPPSICSPSGGKRADIIAVATAYQDSAGVVPFIIIPSGATKAIVTTSSNASQIVGPDALQLLTDEDFITISAVLDLTLQTSSGLLNYAQSTINTGAGTNLYSWIDAPFGSNVNNHIAVGQSTPTLLNTVRFTKSGDTLRIIQSNTTIRTAFMVEFTASLTNSLNELAFKRFVFLTSQQTLRTHIPAGTDIIVINRKGTVRKCNNTTIGGTEEGYLDSRLVMDLENGRTDGFVTTVNGARRAFRSTYTVTNHPTNSTQRFIQAGNVAGDYLNKNATLSNSTNDIGIEDPTVYVDGDTLHFQRRNNYRSDFDDVVVLEFFTRTGFGMAVEFIESQTRFIAKGAGTTTGTSRVFDIPAGTNYIFLRQAGNANNSPAAHNENALSAYAVIDMQSETANGFYWQQVGFTPAPSILRRDDNYVFIGLPLNGTSSRNSTYSQGVYYTTAPVYDLDFTLNAAKTKLTVTNKFGLVANEYQLVTMADFFGARPDFAFSDSLNTDYEFYNNGNCDEMRLRITVCNPGSGDSPADLPVSFYDKNPTTDATARLLHVATFATPIVQETCEDFIFDINYGALSIADPNIVIYAVTNDNGSFVPGGVGNTVGTPFALTSLASQSSFYKECDYSNNLIALTVSGVMLNATSAPLTTSSASPTIITGTFDAARAQTNGLSVTVNANTYTLGINSELTAIGNNWALDLTANQPAIGVYDVAVTSSNAKGDAVDCTTSELTIVDPLKVSWLSFDVKLINDKAHLVWETASEENNSHFEIQRAGKDLKFEKIGTVMGVGNASDVSTYSFVDQNGLDEYNYYRLQDVDFNGQHSYSVVRFLQNKKQSTEKLQLFPNPSNGTFTLKGNLKSGGSVQLIVRDLQGKTVVSEKYEFNDSKFELNKNWAGFSKGLYLIQIIEQDFIQSIPLMIN